MTKPRVLTSQAGQYRSQTRRKVRMQRVMDSAALSPQDCQQLLQELEAHQIELERQIEELHRLQPLRGRCLLNARVISAAEIMALSNLMNDLINSKGPR